MSDIRAFVESEKKEAVRCLCYVSTKGTQAKSMATELPQQSLPPHCGSSESSRILARRLRVNCHATSDATSSEAIPTGNASAANACSWSAIRSPASSMPTDIRTRSAGSSRSLPTSGGTLACDMQPGKLIVELMLLKLTQMLNMRVASTILREDSTDPVVKLSTAPTPRACLCCKR